MRSVFLALLLLAGSVQAEETLMCGQYGYTDKSEDFHRITTVPRVTVFSVEADKITVGDDTYTIADPSQVGLEGLAITYFQKDNAKVLYLYINEHGRKEVGISSLRQDSDDLFVDKSVFTGCEAKTAVREEVVVSKTSLRRKVDPTQPLFTF